MIYYVNIINVCCNMNHNYAIIVCVPKFCGTSIVLLLFIILIIVSFNILN